MCSRTLFPRWLSTLSCCNVHLQLVRNARARFTVVVEYWRACERPAHCVSAFTESSMALLCSHSLSMCLPHGLACRPLLEVSKHSSQDAMVSHVRMSQDAGCSPRFRSCRTRQHCELRYNVSRRHCLLHTTGGRGYSSTASRSCLRKPLRAHSKHCRPFNAARRCPPTRVQAWR